MRIGKRREKNYHFSERDGSASLVFTEIKDKDAIDYLNSIVKNPSNWRFEFVSDMETGEEDLDYELEV